MAMEPPPWLKARDNAWQPRAWTDHDDTLPTDWLQAQGIGVPITVTASAVEAVAKDASFHPRRDHLPRLTWAGTKRVGRFAATYLGAEGTPYHNEVSKRMLIAAVARIMQPGCKHDHMPNWARHDEMATPSKPAQKTARAVEGPRPGAAGNQALLGRERHGGAACERDL